MRHQCAQRVAALTTTGALLTGCASSASLLTPGGPQAAHVAGVIDQLERKIRVREPSIGQIFIDINSLRERGEARTA